MGDALLVWKAHEKSSAVSCSIFKTQAAAGLIYLHTDLTNSYQIHHTLRGVKEPLLPFPFESFLFIILFPVPEHYQHTTKTATCLSSRST